MNELEPSQLPSTENTETNSDEKPFFRAIEEMHEPIKKISTELNEDLRQGNISLIIGDDVSGRIPALIFTEIANQAKPQNQEKTRCIFFTGSSGLKKPEQKQKTRQIMKQLKQDASSWEAAHKGKVLITTEAIVTGNSLKPLIDALKILNLDFAIATIGVDNPYVFIRPGVKDINVPRLEKNLGCKIFYGEIGTPRIYNNKWLTGYWKEQKKLHSKRLKGMQAEIEERKKVMMGRKAAKQLGQTIAQELGFMQTK